MSKLLLFDFKCNSCGHRYDDLVPSTVKTGECPQCQGQSVRLISSPRIDPRLGIDPDYSTMADKWAKKHEQMRHLDERREKEQGPDSWGSSGGDVRR